MGTSGVPQEIVEEILLGSPVKALVRFKCLSKSCNSLISSPAFARLHLQQTRKVPNISSNQKILGQTCLDLVFFDSEAAFGDDQIALPRLDFPPQKKLPPRIKIIGSCNGLLAFVDPDKDFFLWNPSTGDYKKLPVPYYVPRTGGYERFLAPGVYSSYYAFFTGFGYDSTSDDYKVLFGIRSWRRSDAGENRVAIFSLRQNSWRIIQPPLADPPVFYYQTGPFVNGALHWTCTHGILVFDLKMERFSTVPTPHPGRFGVLDGKLCLTMYKGNDTGPPFSPEVWVMKEYGVQNSWTKLLTLRVDANFWNPLCISKGNAVISMTDKGLVRCDPEGTKSEFFKICECGRRYFRHEVILHAESLLSPNNINSNSFDWTEEEQKQGSYMSC